MSLRPVKQISRPQPTLEGAGVRLQRAFGFGKTEDFDHAADGDCWWRRAFRNAFPLEIEPRRRAIDGGDTRASCRELRGLAAGRRAEIRHRLARDIAQQPRR